MHRPLPLCWQLNYSGSKAEKDTFTSIEVEALSSQQNQTQDRKSYIFSKPTDGTTLFLRHLFANAPRFVLYLHTILLNGFIVLSYDVVQPNTNRHCVTDFLFRWLFVCLMLSILFVRIAFPLFT